MFLLDFCVSQSSGCHLMNANGYSSNIMDMVIQSRHTCMACVHVDAMAAYFYVALTWMDGWMDGRRELWQR